MNPPSIQVLQKRMQAVKDAPLFAKAQSAELALNDFLLYLSVQDARIATLERMVSHVWKKESADS